MYEPYCANYTDAVEILLTVEHNLMVSTLLEYVQNRLSRPLPPLLPTATEPSLPSRLLFVVTRRFQRSNKSGRDPNYRHTFPRATAHTHMLTHYIFPVLVCHPHQYKGIARVPHQTCSAYMQVPTPFRGADPRSICGQYS